MTTSTVSYVVWGSLLGAALILWWISYRQPTAVARPGDLIGWLSTHPVWRVVLVVSWMFLGWHFFAR